MILTNHNDKGADDDIAAANELLETSGVDLTIKDSTINLKTETKSRQNLDVSAKTNEASSSKGKYQVTKENKILQQIFITFLHVWKTKFQ